MSRSFLLRFLLGVAVTSSSVYWLASGEKDIHQSVPPGIFSKDVPTPLLLALCPLFRFLKARRELNATFLISLVWFSKVFKVIYFYPAVWVCSCMICGGLHACHVWENSHDAGYRRGGVRGVLAGHASYLGESAVMCCMSFTGRTVGGVVKLLVEFIAPCWVLHPSYCEPPPIFFALSCHHSGQLCGSPQGSGPGEEERGQCPAQLGKRGTHYALTFPIRETADFSGLFWHWAVSPWGRDYAGNLKRFFLPFLLHLFSHFFAPRMCWDPSAGLLGSHKDTLIHVWLSKSVFL